MKSYRFKFPYLPVCCAAFFFFGAAHVGAQSLFDSLRLARTVEIYFASGKADVSPETSVALDSLAAFFRRTPRSVLINIAAHTDSVGTAARNLGLSQRRAAAAQEALVQRGLSSAQIRINFQGEQRPQAANNTEDGRQRNRRATLEVWVSIPMGVLAGQVTDQSTGQGIPATLYLSTKTRRDSARTDSGGYYSLRLPRDSVVRLEAETAGYFFGSYFTKIYGTPALAKRGKLGSPNIKLTPAKPGEKAILQNFFFVGDLPVLLKVSEPELIKLQRFMERNPRLVIEIAGHINKPGTPIPKLLPGEQELSVRRAKTVYDHLLQNGISADRLSYKGYGNTQMLFPKLPATEEQQEQNRRVEIRVLRD